VSPLTGFQPHPTRTTSPSESGVRSARGLPLRALRLRALRLRALRLRGLREIALLAALWIFYSLSRLVAADDLRSARDSAAEVLRLERFLHLDVESWLNRALAPIDQIAVPMSFWYASLHYLVTPAVLAFIYFRHRDEYARARTAIVTGSALGLACYLLLPMAPPRLMGGGYVDVLARTAAYGWWGGDASAPASLGHITNELAAMPSLHVGWTIWVAWAVWRHTNLFGRWLAVLYVAGTTFVVVATGNHWVLDAIGGAVVIAIGIAVAGRLVPARARPVPSTP
jgi:hypothetical protein